MVDAAMPDDAKPRRRGLWAWRIALFLFAILAGALIWAVAVEPMLALGPGASMEQRLTRIGREAVEYSPAILLAIGAWCGAALLRRAGSGKPLRAGGAGTLRAIGAAIFLAGLMQVVGAPSLLATLNTGDPALRTEIDASGFGLLVSGLVLWLVAGAVRRN